MFYTLYIKKKTLKAKKKLRKISYLEMIYDLSIVIVHVDLIAENKNFTNRLFLTMIPKTSFHCFKSIM